MICCSPVLKVRKKMSKELVLSGLVHPSFHPFLIKTLAFLRGAFRLTVQDSRTTLHSPPYYYITKFVFTVISLVHNVEISRKIRGILKGKKQNLKKNKHHNQTEL